MLVTTKDILNIALAGGFILLVIFLSVALMYLILIFRDINKITTHAKDTAKKLNEFILQPIKLVHIFGKKLMPLVDIIEEKIKEKAAQAKKKTGKGKK